ncbi:MAG: TIGR01777 family protein [Planctomycetota bacterium]|nr:MAG: TIGR01777 family protein [Planctomycetota bacterium]
MKILVTGATGLVGSTLLPLLQSDGHETVVLTRKSPRSAQERQWDPEATTLPPAVLDGIEVIVHLAGENIGEGRWTPEKKHRIRESRVHGTQLLARAAAERKGQVQAFISASAIGLYGDRGAEELTEDSPAGNGYLPEVCIAWEAAADPARQAGLRVVNLRLGVVMSRAGGALAKMLLPFKLGAGGIIGSGRQYWSWLTVDEAAEMFRFAVNTRSLSGPVNAVSPQPVTNYEFTKALGAILHRPTIFPLPAFIARIALGEMAQDLILASTRVLPTRLESTGYRFLHGDIETGLRAALKS